MFRYSSGGYKQLLVCIDVEWAWPFKFENMPHSVLTVTLLSNVEAHMTHI